MLTPEDRWKAIEEQMTREFYLYGSIYVVMDPATREMRVISQSEFDITLTPKGYIVKPTLPSEVVPHG